VPSTNNNNKQHHRCVCHAKQSRVGPIEWLKPYTEDKIPELGAAGCKNLVVVPISFVSEHIETLEEIDIEYRELAESAGIEHWRRVPALNTDPEFLEDMADLCLQVTLQLSILLKYMYMYGIRIV
jgi:protoporphyrin/coproporphyrin ferrochelatase